MSNLTFARSKRHNIVEIAINYECLNDRHAIANETAMLQELSRLMNTAKAIHAHGDTPVEPNITMINEDKFYGTLDLKFQIKTKVPGSDGLPIAYSYAGLHAVLVEVSNICAKFRDGFLNFSTYLNLSAMTAPWVLPVDGHGAVLRTGSNMQRFTGTYVASFHKRDGQAHCVDDMAVVGEPKAVRHFAKRWTRLCDEYVALNRRKGMPVTQGPAISVDYLRDWWPNIEWQNIAVMARDRDTQEWHYLGSTHNQMTLNYVKEVGNYMLTKGLGFDNDDTEQTGNVFLHDHDYYEFQDPIF